MEKKQELAFPLTDGQTFATDGMTKRFYAACAAMQGILSNRELQIAIYRDAHSKSSNPNGLSSDEYIISHCYLFADELLKQESNG